MPDEWQRSVLVPIFQGKGDVISCSTYRRVKLLEHITKIVERVLEKKIQKLVNVDAMQFGFMPGRGTTDALFVVHGMQEEYRNKKKKLYMCFVDIEKAFDRVPRKVMEWAMRKKGLLEVIVRAVMSLYHGAKTKVRVDLSHLKNSWYKLVYIKDLCYCHCFCNCNECHFGKCKRRIDE